MNNLPDRRHFIGASLCTLLAACGGGNITSANADQSKDPGAASQKNIDLALAQLDTLVANIMLSTGVPGVAVAVVQGDRKLYAKGFGLRDIRNSALVDADTVFQLASVSKAIAATVIAREVGLGHVNWNQRVSELLPWFALSDPAATQQVTIADLLSHRAGLPDHAGDRLEDIGYSQREVLERLRYLPLDGFRTKHVYTNFGYTAGSLAGAAKSGAEWAALSEQAIYQPLGMSHTSSRFSDFIGRDNRVVGHAKFGGSWAVGSVRMPDAQAPAASVTSSVNDMAKWLSLMIGEGAFGGRRVLDSSALMPAISGQIQTSPGGNGRSAGYYGYGFNVNTTAAGRKSYGHSGAFSSGAATAFMVIPSTGLGIIVLTNGYPIGVPEVINAQFFDLVEHGAIQRDYAAMGRATFDALNAPEGSLVGVQRPTSPKPAQALQTYAGTYRNDYHGTLTVTVSGNSLLLSMGPTPLVLTLAHWDGDVFTFTMSSENAAPGTISKASFAADRVTLEYFNADGLGTFVR